MAAATEDRATEARDGKYMAAPITAGGVLLLGVMVVWASDGYAANGTDTSGVVFAGVVRKEGDNTSGADGDVTGEVHTDGVFKFNHSGLLITDVGKTLYLVDNQTVGLADDTTNAIEVGTLEQWVSSSEVWVRIRPHARPEPRQWTVAADGAAAAGTVNLATVAATLGGTGFKVISIQAALAFVIATGAGAARTLLRVPTDITVASQAVQCVTDQSANRLVITFTGFLY
ncbi:hypothetical protein L6R49_10425 [Myxococcota bacterium]|nr:hypothetical protein [Myxococcota bacterium]